MGILEILLIAVGLSMDAFAVSVAKGISASKISVRDALVAGIWFGGFQALMPWIGYTLGTGFSVLVSSWDHWIAWLLLTLIGGNMLREALSGDEEEKFSGSFSVRTMFPLAIATSIDALAVGVSFAFLRMDIRLPVVLIGLTTLMFSFAGVYLGRSFGSRFKSGAGIVGGLVLIGIGVKILVEHTML